MILSQAERYLCRILPLLLLGLLAAPAVALDDVYLVRHAEKVDFWPPSSDKDKLDAFHPLSCTGLKRADALVDRLKTAGIVAIYTSHTTRTLATGSPLAQATHVPITADDASIDFGEMSDFLARLRKDYAAGQAVLIVGHSNTIPELLARLGAKPDCFQRLGITGQPGSLLIEGYEGMWKVDLKKQGCEAITRQ